MSDVVGGFALAGYWLAILMFLVISHRRLADIPDHLQQILEPLRKKQVLTYNFYLCGTGGDVPFYGQCIFEVQNEL